MASNLVKTAPTKMESIAEQIARIYPPGTNFDQRIAREARARIKLCLSGADAEAHDFARSGFIRLALKAAEDGMKLEDMLKAKKYFRGVKLEGPAVEIEAAVKVMYGSSEGLPDGKKSVFEVVGDVVKRERALREGKPKRKEGEMSVTTEGEALGRFAELARALGMPEGIAPLKKFREGAPVNCWDKMDKAIGELEKPGSGTQQTSAVHAMNGLKPQQ